MRTHRSALRTGLCALLLAPALAAANDYQSILIRLTDAGQILHGSRVIETDPNIAFLHGAFDTLYKVMKTGDIYATKLCANTTAPSWALVRKAGVSPGIVRSNQISGGDGARGFCYVPADAPSVWSPLRLHWPDFRYIYTWNGKFSTPANQNLNWTNSQTGAVSMRGAFYMDVDTLAWRRIGTDVGGVTGVTDFAHRGGPSDISYRAGYSGGRIQLRNSTGIIYPLLASRFYIDRLAASDTPAQGGHFGQGGAVTAVGFDEQEVSSNDEIKEIQVHAPGGAQRKLQPQRFVRDVRLGEDTANSLYRIFSLIDDGVGTVQLDRCHYNMTTACKLPIRYAPPAGRIVVQMTTVPSYHSVD